jgi:MFS family permease
MKSEIYKNYRYNFLVNVFDGGFFGAALGFASFITVIPLFVSTMTESAILIGLIPAIHTIGWQLPQLFTADRVARLHLVKPMVIWMTVHERLPFLGLAVVAFLVPSLGVPLALGLTYTMLVWQGFGGGFTATPWQTMVAKIIPSERRGTFYGFQSALANLFMMGTAVLAGIMLERIPPPLNYALCFFFASIAMAISFVFLAVTREPERVPAQPVGGQPGLWNRMMAILRKDANLRWFLVVRMLSQLSVMGFAFYTIYAVRNLGMTEGMAGLMMGVFTFGQIIANPLMGWMGDHWSHTTVMKFGLLAAAVSGLVAAFAPGLSWFYLVFILAGVANVAIWTIGLALILEFGTEGERPVYIGIANTLIVPATVLSPLLGGWLADNIGFHVTFMVSAGAGLLTVVVLHLMLQDPRKLSGQEAKPWAGDAP